MSGKQICDKTSNNKYLNCPPLMSDGRLFTDYRPRGTIDNIIIQDGEKYLPNFNYRTYMTNNANTIMKKQWDYVKQKAGCSFTNEDYKLLPNSRFKMMPEYVNCECNTHDCNLCNITDSKGLGLTYKKIFKTPVSMTSGLTNPLPLYEDSKYYYLNSSIENSGLIRG